MSGRPKKEKTEILYVRVPQSMSKRLRDEAYKEGRELSGKIRLIIEAYYQERVA
jgi:predicted DNA-binding protein